MRTATRYRLLNPVMAAPGKKNGRAGAIVNGGIHICVDVVGIEFGLKALVTQPRRTIKKGVSDHDIAAHFADVHTWALRVC